MEPNETMREPDNGEELLLLRQVAACDREALTRLFMLYHGRLFKFVFRLTSSYSISEEMVNDVLMVVWEKAGSFRGQSRVSTWIFGIAYRLAMKRLSRRRLRLSRFTGFGDGSADNFAAASGRDGVEIEDWVQSGIHGLPTAQQLAVVLVFYVGLSYDEVADVTATPVNTVKTRMFHARRKLKRILDLKDEHTARTNGSQNND